MASCLGKNDSEVLLGLKRNVIVKDRFYRLKVYKSTFLGTDAVSCIQNHLGCDEDAAIKAGDRLLHAGYIAHCCGDHSLLNEKLFYVFLADDADQGSQGPPKPPPKPKAKLRVTAGLPKKAVKGVAGLPRGARRKVQSGNSSSQEIDPMDEVQALQVHLDKTALEQARQHRRLQMLAAIVVLHLVLSTLLTSFKGGLLSLGLSAARWWLGLFPAGGPDPTAYRPSPRSDGPADGGPEPQRAELPYLPPPPVETWRHRPLLLRFNPLVGHGASPKQPLPINADTVLPFETSLFKGHLHVLVRDCPGAPPSDYFAGKTRKIRFVVQGRFSHDHPMRTLLTGEEQQRPLANLPPRWVLSTIFGVVRKLSPGLKEDVQGDKPYCLSLLAATAQALRCDLPGQEPKFLADVEEQTHLLGAHFGTRAVPSVERKKFFSLPDNAGKYQFKSEYVYTFDFYQHMFLPTTFTLAVPIGGSFDLAKHLNGQPIHFMAKSEAGEYLWNLELWHERLLAAA